MKSVNIIYYNNGVGLIKDAQIIKNLLKNEFNCTDFNVTDENCPQADINIFLQTIDINTEKFTSKAKKNILIPNIEWMFRENLSMLSNIDLILTKSQYSKAILDEYHNNVVYVGFTSIDRYDSSIDKTPDSFLHVAGKSIQKNTELVIDVFSELKLPITILDSTARFLNNTPPNINYITEFLSEDELSKLFNSYETHICCSFAEGWGHYIYEALSCKSLVITTDCPPANELLTNDDVFFVKPTTDYEIKSMPFSEEWEYPLRKLTYTNKNDLIKTIKNISFLNPKTIDVIRDNSRNAYLRINKEFMNKKEEFYDLLA